MQSFLPSSSPKDSLLLALGHKGSVERLEDLRDQLTRCFSIMSPLPSDIENAMDPKKFNIDKILSGIHKNLSKNQYELGKTSDIVVTIQNHVNIVLLHHASAAIYSHRGKLGKQIYAQIKSIDSIVFHANNVSTYQYQQALLLIVLNRYEDIQRYYKTRNKKLEKFYQDKVDEINKQIHAVTTHIARNTSLLHRPLGSHVKIFLKHDVTSRTGLLKFLEEKLNSLAHFEFIPNLLKKIREKDLGKILLSIEEHITYLKNLDDLHSGIHLFLYLKASIYLHMGKQDLFLTVLEEDSSLISQLMTSKSMNSLDAIDYLSDQSINYSYLLDYYIQKGDIDFVRLYHQKIEHTSNALNFWTLIRSSITAPTKSTGVTSPSVATAPIEPPPFSLVKSFINGSVEKIAKYATDHLTIAVSSALGTSVAPAALEGSSSSEFMPVSSASVPPAVAYEDSSQSVSTSVIVGVLIGVVTVASAVWWYCRSKSKSKTEFTPTHSVPVSETKGASSSFSVSSTSRNRERGDRSGLLKKKAASQVIDKTPVASIEKIAPSAAKKSAPETQESKIIHMEEKKKTSERLGLEDRFASIVRRAKRIKNISEVEWNKNTKAKYITREVSRLQSNLSQINKTTLDILERNVESLEKAIEEKERNLEKEKERRVAIKSPAAAAARVAAEGRGGLTSAVTLFATTEAAGGGSTGPAAPAPVLATMEATDGGSGISADAKTPAVILPSVVYSKKLSLVENAIKKLNGIIPFAAKDPISPEELRFIRYEMIGILSRIMEAIAEDSPDADGFDSLFKIKAKKIRNALYHHFHDLYPLRSESRINNQVIFNNIHKMLTFVQKCLNTPNESARSNESKDLFILLRTFGWQGLLNYRDDPSAEEALALVHHRYDPDLAALAERMDLDEEVWLEAFGFLTGVMAALLNIEGVSIAARNAYEDLIRVGNAYRHHPTGLIRAQCLKVIHEFQGISIDFSMRVVPAAAGAGSSASMAAAGSVSPASMAAAGSVSPASMAAAGAVSPASMAAAGAASSASIKNKC